MKSIKLYFVLCSLLLYMHDALSSFLPRFQTCLVQYNTEVVISTTRHPMTCIRCLRMGRIILLPRPLTLHSPRPDPARNTPIFSQFFCSFSTNAPIKIWICILFSVLLSILISLNVIVVKFICKCIRTCRLAMTLPYIK